MQEIKEKSLGEVIAPLLLAGRKFWKIAVGPALAVFGIVGILAWRIPSYYVADTSIFMQPRRISSKIIEEEKKEEVGERLQSLIQEILSRQRLRAIVDRFKLYPEYSGVEGSNRALKKLNDSIQVVPKQAIAGGQLSQSFRLSFSHRDPNVAFEVTKVLANLFIEESVIDRRSEVQGTEDFFDAQLEDARKRLEEIETREQQYKEQNSGRLPDIEQIKARLELLKAQLESNTQQLNANVARRENYQKELEEIRRFTEEPVMTGGGNADAGMDPSTAINQLEMTLSMQRTKYTEEHPEIVATKKRIEALRAQASNPRRQTYSNSRGRRSRRYSAQNEGVTLNVKRQIAEVDIAVNLQKEETERLKQQIEALDTDLRQMPVREQELIKIRRDYVTQKEYYDRLTAERDAARLQSSMLRSQKAQQLKVTEPAERPVEPAGPPRLIILMGGAAVALLVFFGIPVVMYFLNWSFRSKEEVEESLGVKVLGVIPPMITPEALAIGRRTQWISMIASMMSFAVLSAVIFVFVR